MRAAFDRAAASYDAAAEFQRLICDRLVALLPCERTPATIADLGCGTGYTSAALATRYPQAELYALDFAPAMLGVARARANARHWIAADVQHLPLRSASMDLLCSSLALQWCDSAAAFDEAARVLRPGGTLALATVGPGTLHELAKAFAGIDEHDHVLHFHALDALEEQIRSAGFALRLARREDLTRFRPDLRAIVRELKAIGANNVGPRRRRGVLGRAAWRGVEQRYEALRRPQGLPVTYAALYLIGERP